MNSDDRRPLGVAREAADAEHADQTRFGAATLRWFYDLAAQGILTTDEELRIRSWNHWLELQTGWSAAEMIGRGLLEAFPELLERGLDHYYRAALDGEIKLLSHRLHRYLLRFERGGVAGLPLMQQHARIAPLLSDGRVVGTITVIDDVTERVEREAELDRQVEERGRLLESERRARALAEEASRLKDEFLATVSHELRTPLNAILGWARLLRDGTLDEGGAARASQVIERNALAQAHLIEDLLDISRIVSGRLRLTAEPVSLDAVVRAALESAEPVAAQKDVRLEIRSDGRAARVSGDPDRLQQIVWNLLTNAIKFSDRGGLVLAEVAVVGDEAEVRVEDSGIGIEPEFLPYVFDRFRQADGTASRKYGGLGLGLSIVHHLAEMHGGAVRAESPGRGQGAKFIVTLPLWNGPVDSNSAPTTPSRFEDSSLTAPRSLEGVRVLVVDDERDSREMLAYGLECSGATVDLAASAAECLEALGRAVPDVLIVDIGMPGTSGYDLIRSVRALPEERGGRVPAVAVTGYAREVDRGSALASGFQDHLPKPLDVPRLVACIAALTARNEAPTESP